MAVHEKCGHGKKWAEQCDDCDKISFEEKLRWMTEDMENAVKWYEQKPFVSDEDQIIANLYSAIGRLTGLIAAADRRAKRNAKRVM